MRSLRKTLVLGTTLATASIFVIAGILLYALVRASLLAQFDQSLLDKAQILASAVEREDGELELGFDDLDMREFQGDEPAAYMQLRLADGSPLYRSSDASNDELKLPGKPQELPVFGQIALCDGRQGRAVMFRFLPRGSQELPAREDGSKDNAPSASQRNSTAAAIDFLMARSTGALDETLAYLGGLLLLVGATAIAASTGVLWWIVRRSVRPLEQLAKEIGRFKEDDLAKRIDLDVAPIEVQPVVDRLNDLLGRLEDAFRRERTFSANVAHELRNPLAGLRLKMDVAMSRTREPSEYKQAIDDCRSITVQMQGMVENLLSLARLEAGQVQVRYESLELGQLVRDQWEPLDAAAAARMLNVRWSQEDDVPIVTDPSLASVVVRNVLENAVAYTNEGGTLRIDVGSADGQASLDVCNSGSQLSQTQVESAFQQFWRGDEARSEAAVHCGLGLPLVRKIATVLGGTVVARTSVDGDFEISISIPNVAGQNVGRIA